MSGLDVVVAGARVVDGTGGPWFRADVGVAGDRIAAVGALDDVPAVERVDGGDLTLVPGLIDAHVHGETHLLRDDAWLADLRQGVTTHIAGQDGIGLAPTDEATLEFMFRSMRPILGERNGTPPRSIAAFLEAYDRAAPINVATLIPNGCVRMMVMGNVAGPAGPEEIEAMREWCRQGMREGAIGLSSGLDYVPSGYADTAELSALAAAVAEYGGVYVSHVRYELGLRAALEEALEISRRSGAAPHISHLMAEPENGIPPEEVIAILDGARADGLDVTFDLYPYTFGCTTLLFVLPLWVMEGDADTIQARLSDAGVRARLRAELDGRLAAWGEIEVAGELDTRFASLRGLDLLEAAARAGCHPVDLVCDLLVTHDLDVLLLGVDANDPIRERALEPMLAHPAHMLGSDGIHARGRCHPRTYGAAARYLGRFVRERGILPFEEAVRHATSLPAARYGLADRGLIRPGMAADLVLLDPDALVDRATREARTPADGVRDVWVNGTRVLRGGEPTGATPGRGLRRAQCVGGSASAFTHTDL